MGRSSSVGHCSSSSQLIAVVDAGAGEEADPPLKTRDHQCIAMLMVSPVNANQESILPGTDVKAAIVRGEKHPLQSEAKQKAAIMGSDRQTEQMKRLAGLKGLKLHISPLTDAKEEERLMIHAFIIGYAT